MKKCWPIGTYLYMPGQETHVRSKLSSLLGQERTIEALMFTLLSKGTYIIAFDVSVIHIHCHPY
jgi:hypothetical protein